MCRWNNNVLFNTLIALVIFSISIPAIGGYHKDEKVYSNTAVSQTGRFLVSYAHPLILSSISDSTAQFLTYRNQSGNVLITLGPVSGDVDLNTICSHPDFLEKEHIADIKNIDESDIRYFSEHQFNGCIINLKNNESVLIVSLPKPFLNSMEENIKYVAVISDKNIIDELKLSISFQPFAADIFINILQIAQLESPFSKEINWEKIKLEGMTFTRKEADYCVGLVAAQKYLIPVLRQLDFHSLFTESSSHPADCILPPNEEDVDSNDKWEIIKALPSEQQERISSHIFDFHGTQLNHHISYLSIPAINEVSRSEVNQKIENGRIALKHAGIDKACGLIVDLRFSMGGNYFPMVLAVSSVLNSGELFRLGESTHVLLNDDGNKIGFMTDDNEVDDIFKYTGPTPNKYKIPVAILINWTTASSSNITSIVLHDNSVQSKVFGMRSSPTTSANMMNFLIDRHALNIMSERIYSNKGELLPLALPVDEEIADDYSTIFDPDKDLTIKSAKKWLESLPACNGA